MLNMMSGGLFFKTLTLMVIIILKKVGSVINIRTIAVEMAIVIIGVIKIAKSSTLKW